jgi:exopolyphosphatase/guanosine-5'-triphosphate,3'-diphosphate pyrophosphatase
VTSDRAPSSDTVVGAVDAGSNTFKMTVGRRDPDGGLEVLATTAETIRLGAGLGTSGALRDDRIEAALATLHRFAEIARSHGATRLIGVATEATRRAANGAAFLQRVREETGWDLRVISGDEEAALTFQGLSLAFDLAGTVVVADIGGASTEVIVAESGTVERAQSVALGSGLLTDELVSSDPPTVAELDACTHAATGSLSAVPLPAPGSTRLIAVGGTGEYLARLVPDPRRIGMREIEAALDICRSEPSDQLAVTLQIPPARARVLPAGIAIVRALAERLQPERVEVGQSGIRTGLLLATFAEIDQAGSTLDEHDQGGAYGNA